MAGVREADCVADIGCGDGRVVVRHITREACGGPPVAASFRAFLAGGARDRRKRGGGAPSIPGAPRTPS